MRPEPEWDTMDMDWKGAHGAWIGEKLHAHFRDAENLVAKLLKTEEGRKAIAAVTKQGGVQYWERVLRQRLIVR